MSVIRIYADTSVFGGAFDEEFQAARDGGRTGVRESAGINRHGVADERAVQERSSAPFWPRVMRRWP